MPIYCKFLYIVISLVLVDFHANAGQIAISKNPSKFEKTAADELKYFLNQIGNSEYKIILETDVSGENIIYLGQTEFAKKNRIDFASFDKEEWILKTINGNLVISGGRPVGTLYGVYALLEKLGCYFLTMDQNVIPTVKSLSLPILNERKKPFFAGRNIYDNYPRMLEKRSLSTENYWKFRLRSRANGGQGRRPAVIYTGDMFRLSNAIPNCHNFYQYVEPEKYFKTHPEYFSMNELGERFVKMPGGSQLCLTNPDIIKITLASLRKIIHQDRESLPRDEWPVVYDISAMDSSKFMCLCPNCKAVTTQEGSEAGLVLRYINAVAAAIAKEYPEIMIRTFAYSSAELAPKLTRPTSNVIIQYCDLYSWSDCYRPLTHPVNAEQLKKLEDWNKLNCKLALWDYWNMGIPSSFDPPRPEVVVDAIQPDFQLFGKLGIVSLFLEAEKHFITPQNFIDLEYFLAYQLMVDPERDVESLINIYMDNYYGKAAPLMKKYLQMLRNGVRKYPNAQFTMRVSSWDYMTPKFMLDTYKLLHEAENTVKDNDIYRQRVREELIAPLWTTLYFRNYFKDYFMKNKIAFPSLEEECRQLVLEFMNKYNPKNIQADIKEFETYFSVLTANLPRPERFRNLPENAVKVFGYPHCGLHTSRFHSYIREDSESPTGHTYSSEHPDSKMHGKDARQKNLMAATFGIYKYGKDQKTIQITEFPSDEKYHWYKIPRFEIGSKTMFWGHFWFIQYDISSAYANADGLKDGNVWDIWFSAKFTGPAYVKGSKKKNAVCVDMVVLTKP